MTQRARAARWASDSLPTSVEAAPEPTLPDTKHKRAEGLGYARAWFFDTQMLKADLFVAMGAAAVQTSRMRLGTGVLIPGNRFAPVAASALASLNQLAPGRIAFGSSAAR
jgi:alkanesulfonate monooxygenase SsuD/methylene tetrahydromethanopterin reductase-like flavin-dependent oxidoreductase (luciferase family)